MEKFLKKAVLTASILTALTHSALGETEYRINSSVSYYENEQFFHGTDEEYNPLRKTVEIEFDNDFWFFNKFFIKPFYGRYGGEYDVGIDFGLKKIFQGEEISPYLYGSLGAIHLSKEFEKHKYRDNFDVNFGAGLEIKISKNFALVFSADYNHISKAKKLFNNLKDNSGNPGLNLFGFSVGFTYKPKKD